jgi:Protein of unknown function (DUF1761)
MNRQKFNHWAVILTALAAFMLSMIWYSPLLFGEIWVRYGHANPGAMPLWKTLIAPLRELIAAYMLAYLILKIGIIDWRAAAWLGLSLWGAFHAVQMAGAVIWDNMPWKLGCVHAGDWLMKMLFMSVILCLWHRRKAG